jgi:hypothetical protein
MPPLGHPVRRPPGGRRSTRTPAPPTAPTSTPAANRPEQQGTRRLHARPSTGGRRRGLHGVPDGGAVPAPPARPAVRQGAGRRVRAAFIGIGIERFAKARWTADWSAAACRATRSGARGVYWFRGGAGSSMRSKDSTPCGAVCRSAHAGPRRGPPVPPAACSTWNTLGSCRGACFTWNIPGARPITPADELLTSGYAADCGRPSAIGPAPLGLCAHVMQARTSVSGVEQIDPSVTVRAWESAVGIGHLREATERPAICPHNSISRTARVFHVEHPGRSLVLGGG